ncbi:ATP-binding protein [Pseudomonas kurunegalensis]|uniref:ATP-binding protein n=1 Tax=Pseudomonas kurunegalensis TaxID=485880 RepID=UPI00236452C8|nr:ATP-binding protein [Pseudomonas kurunegalensis]MDD2136708.1 ATP-binding protein [Pseudomonas kurunegalensis]
MKLLTDDHYLRQKRIAKQRNWQKHGRTRTKKNPCICHKTSEESLTIEAPEVIGLHSKTLHSNLTKFLSTLRKESLRQRRIRIDFSKTNKVISTGMLLMLAEIDRLRIVLGDKCRITCSYPQDETVEKVFQQIGFFNILDKPHRLEINEDDITVKNWRYASGVSVNPKDADILLKAIRDKIPKGYLRLVPGVSEAMDNAVHHAYLRPREDRISRSGLDKSNDKRWWVFAQVHDGRLSVIFCDLGLGIPVTLPEKWSESIADIVRLTSLSPGKRDMRMIRRALELGRTRTDQGHRGKGLAQNVMKAAEELRGKLHVYSNAGVVGVDFSEGTPTYIQDGHQRSILGTVIQWSVQITDEQVQEDENVEN